MFRDCKDLWEEHVGTPPIGGALESKPLRPNCNNGRSRRHPLSTRIHIARPCRAGGGLSGPAPAPVRAMADAMPLRSAALSSRVTAGVGGGPAWCRTGVNPPTGASHAPHCSEYLMMTPTPVRTLIFSASSVEVHVTTVGRELPPPVKPVLVMIPPVILVPVGIIDDTVTCTAHHR